MHAHRHSHSHLGHSHADPVHNAASAPPEQVVLMRRATTLSLIVATFLILLKFAAWSVTDSLSLLSSLVDSMLDLLSSAVNFVALRYALMPADEEHRFGHGSAEDIASLAQSAFIAGSGLFILGEGFHRFFSPVPVEHGLAGFAVMGISILATGGLVAYQQYVIRRSSSSVVKADSLHYVTDLLTNLGVIVALGLSMYLGWTWADPLFGVVISIYILYGAWQIGFAAFHNLMDREFVEEERQQIIRIVSSDKRTKGLHDLKTRQSGIYRFIQFHLDLHGSLSLNEAHVISEDIERELKAAFPTAEIIIHEDAV